MPNIAIIGGGIFGATIALSLSEAGFDVDLFERQGELIRGASLNNQNRLHLGFHYPRDIETGRQCIRGFVEFQQAFPSCINGSFVNAYLISNSNSLTSLDDYFEFCDQLGVEYAPLDLDTFPVELRNVSGGVLCREVVYDAAELRRTVLHRLYDSGVSVHLYHELQEILNKGPLLHLKFKNRPDYKFDAVVNATYANINRFTEMLGHEVQENQYEYTAVPVVELAFPQSLGVTVMDGQFVTVLPYGHSGRYLLYHVKHSVVERITGKHLPASWLNKATAPLANVDKPCLFERMRYEAEAFVPALRDAVVVDHLEGPRMVLARSDATDARPSIINAVQDNYLTVFSGKIDHCLWVARDVTRHFESR